MTNVRCLSVRSVRRTCPHCPRWPPDDELAENADPWRMRHLTLQIARPHSAPRDWCRGHALPDPVRPSVSHASQGSAALKGSHRARATACSWVSGAHTQAVVQNGCRMVDTLGRFLRPPCAMAGAEKQQGGCGGMFTDWRDAMSAAAAHGGGGGGAFHLNGDLSK